MKRARIDQAVRKQLARLEVMLRDVHRSGGGDRWSYLFSRGHRFPTILSAVRQGHLSRNDYEFELTKQGHQYLDALEDARIKGNSE